MWTVKAALDWTVGYLESKGDENPRLSAEWLLSKATGLTRIELYVNFDRPLTQAERDIFHDYVVQRACGKPLQYITGEVAFRHLILSVSPGVLIPRPETEVLVSEALKLLPQPPRPRAREEFASDDEEATSEQAAESALDDSRVACDKGEEQHNSPEKLLVADIGTGSGCIAASLAYEHPLVQVVATDISPQAVALARNNVAKYELDERVRVLEGNLGEPILAADAHASSDKIPLMGRFDLIVSNPPYIPTAVLQTIPDEVLNFEPTLALDGGEDGLSVLRLLLPFTLNALKPGAAFVFELHEDCLEEARTSAEDAGFTDVRIVEDLAGRQRLLIGHTPQGEMQ
ncbi:HemK/PrmC family methyltransferase [Eggerthellaceae bacterium 3-80]|nr:peptide chain release factor N(5)-glutamine methyltransferase [bacterium D16-34]